jgi:hypothetical protein
MALTVIMLTILGAWSFVLSNDSNRLLIQVNSLIQFGNWYSKLELNLHLDIPVTLSNANFYWTKYLPYHQYHIPLDLTFSMALRPKFHSFYIQINHVNSLG